MFLHQFTFMHEKKDNKKQRAENNNQCRKRTAHACYWCYCLIRSLTIHNCIIHTHNYWGSNRLAQHKRLRKQVIIIITFHIPAIRINLHRNCQLFWIIRYLQRIPRLRKQDTRPIL